MIEPDTYGMPKGLTKEEQVSIAQKMEHPDSEYWEKLPADLVEALRFEVECDSVVDDFREEMWSQLEVWAREAGPRTRILLESAPAELRPILARINLGLVERLLLELELLGAPLKDEWFMRDLIFGFRQIGLLPPSSEGTQEYTKNRAKLSVEEFMARRQETNEKVVANLSESAYAHELEAICLEDAMLDSMTKPRQVSVNGKI